MIVVYYLGFDVVWHAEFIQDDSPDYLDAHNDFLCCRNESLLMIIGHNEWEN